MLLQINEEIKMKNLYYLALVALFCVGVCTETFNPDSGSDDLIHLDFVYKGSQGNMKCSVSGSPSLESAAYSWTYHGLPQIDHVHFDGSEGSFYIDKADTKDTGRYDCWETGIDEQGRDITRKNHHRLIVYELPEIELRIEESYHVARCVPQLDKIAVAKYAHMLCTEYNEGNCPYSVSNNCKTLSTDSDIDNPEEEMTIVVVIKPIDFIPPSCDATCIRMNLAEHLNNLEIKMTGIWDSLFRYDIKMSEWYHHVPSMRKQSLSDNCPTGYVPFMGAVCAPCEPGHFWTAGYCYSCPPNTFQDVGNGIGNCKPCPDLSVTEAFGSTSVSDCQPPTKDARSLQFAAARSQRMLRFFGILTVVGMLVFVIVVVLTCVIIINKKRKVHEYESKVNFDNRLRDAEQLNLMHEYSEQQRIQNSNDTLTQSIKLEEDCSCPSCTALQKQNGPIK